MIPFLVLLLVLVFGTACSETPIEAAGEVKEEEVIDKPEEEIVVEVVEEEAKQGKIF